MRIKEDEILEILIINKEYSIREIVEKIYKKKFKITSPEYVYIIKIMLRLNKHDNIKKRFDGRYVYYTKTK